MIRRLALLVLVAALAASGAPVAAHDHEPPRTRLTAGRTEQRGMQWSYCWTKKGPEPGIYEQLCVDMVPDWPDAKRARAGRAARIRIFKRAAPRDVALSYWRDVDDRNIPQGEQRELSFSVEPATVDGRRVHDVIFRLPRRTRHAYIELFATWPDEQGSDTIQDSFFRFHLRLRR
ncbi:MAG: hypothetical protein ACRDKT_12560 [Actinomycetota bacterium]